ncbi:MAG TPA: ACP S-malonyltransferase [Acidimicrobiales bacterium]|nr:ACP S-malonyltransferase [Acidimicrobiales bacterium]
MLVFTFPGQGSQTSQMGRPWVDHPSWELVEEASIAVERDIGALLLDADQQTLTETHNAQLATFVLSMVVLDAVERLGIVPAYVAGHSLGEYSALCAAGALGFEDAVGLVAERGEAMRSAAEARTGSMSAVLGLDDDKVDAACHRADGDVWVANFNAPGQVVIAGDPDAIADAAAVATDLGAKRIMALDVSGAFHTPFMAPARERLDKALAAVDMRTPSVPVIANVDALPHSDADSWPSLLGSQLSSPVRWRQSLQQLDDEGATTFLELGPGTVLTGTVKRTLRGSRRLSVDAPGQLDAALEVLTNTPATEPDRHRGEHLHTSARLVVSPGSGLFTPGEVTEGTAVDAGDVIGLVGETEIRTPFSGSLMGLLALSGERISSSQPVAWLNAAVVAS